MVETSSVKVQVRCGADRLASSSREPQHDAALLLRHVLQRDRAWMLAHPDALLTAAEIDAYRVLLARRAKHEPMQYILGEQEFYGLRFVVTPNVLIPRPETEHLVEAVLGRLLRERSTRIADVGTGSGAIAVALAHSLSLAQIDALDMSPQALQIAKANAAIHDVADRIRFVKSDLLAAVAGEHYDCIVSNPPYVANDEPLELQVALWEPHAALFAGVDGLAIYRRLLPQAVERLKVGGLLALELGAGQREALTTLFRKESRWDVPEFIRDLQGIDRVALAIKR